jgi:hypothetical protein
VGFFIFPLSFPILFVKINLVFQIPHTRLFFMKKVINVLIFAAFTFLFSATKTQAQIYKEFPPVKAVLENADTTTIIIGGVTTDVLAFIFEADKVSGTVAGTATLQGSRDGITWVTVGSVYTITNVTKNIGVIEPSRLIWARYRFNVITSGTCKINNVKAFTLRRTAK